MKIGLTTTSFRWDQGAERFVINLTKGLLKAGQEVHVIGRLEKMNALEQFLDQLQPEEKRLFNFHRVKTIKATRYTNLVTYAYAVHKHLKKLDVDIVQGFGKSLGLDVFRPPTGTHKSFMLNLNRRLHLEPCTYQEFSIERRLLFDVAKTIVVNSNLSKNRILEVYPGVTTPIKIIPNMVDFTYWQQETAEDQRQEVRKELSIPDDAIVYLHVSTNFKNKGVPETLAALKMLENRVSKEVFDKIYLILVGDNNYKLDSEYADKIRIFPRTNEVRPYFYAADILLHPTLFDSFSNVVVEGLVCGMPVVTTTMNGAAEAIDHEKSGLIIDSKNAKPLADSMELLLNKTRREEMKQAASEKSLSYTPDAITNRYLELYKEVLEKDPVRRTDFTVKPWHALTERAVKKDFEEHFKQLKLN